MGEVQLTCDVKSLFRDLVNSNQVLATFIDAVEYVAQEFENAEPRGHSCPVRSESDINYAISVSSGGAPVLFSGCLHQLALREAAVPGPLDLGRCAMQMETLTTTKDLGCMLSPMVVNIDLATWHDSRPFDMRRAHRDAEVICACLVLFWHRNEPPAIKDELARITCDIAYDGRALGSGTSFEVAKLKLCEREEEPRPQLPGGRAHLRGGGA
jgi:hypothetical protein